MWSCKSLLLAEAVEKVRTPTIIETMIYYSGVSREYIAKSAYYQNKSCTKIDSPDFFNSLSHKETYGVGVRLLSLEGAKAHHTKGAAITRKKGKAITMPNRMRTASPM